MKKLMIALAVVAMGVAANAANFSWSCLSGRIFDGTGTTGAAGYTPSIGLKAYVFDAGVYSQDQLVADLAGTGIDMSKAMGEATVNSDARVDPTAFAYDVDKSFQAYMVVVGADKVFVSADMASGYQKSSTQAIDFESQSTPSKSTFEAGTGAYTANGAGWYSAVPEPTSGLLLLLGVAGLALRRRRA